MNQRRAIRFKADVAHLAALRAFAAKTADDLGATVDPDDLALVVGELTANAAVHQTTEAELVIAALPDHGVQIEVCDGDDAQPRVIRSVGWDAEGHRGMMLVEAISAEWGVEPEPQGKRVWARLAPVSA